MSQVLIYQKFIVFNIRKGIPINNLPQNLNQFTSKALKIIILRFNQIHQELHPCRNIFKQMTSVTLTFDKNKFTEISYYLRPIVCPSLLVQGF